MEFAKMQTAKLDLQRVLVFSSVLVYMKSLWTGCAVLMFKLNAQLRHGLEKLPKK